MYDCEIHHRRSIRLRGYDYSCAGAYFVTVCVAGMERALSRITEDGLELTEFGQIVRGCWKALPKHYAHVELDEFVVMPNHVHGIIVLTEVGAGLRPAPTKSRVGAGLRPARTGPAPTKHPLSEIIRAFKSFSARAINSARSIPRARFWQRNYYEHIVRNQVELEKIREYVRLNPLLWATDRYNQEGTVAVIDEDGRVVPWEQM
ncbi:MAG: transposase [Acidobacteria bacterium]|nr:transposase [Acidobacteriota bacterium]